MLVKKIEFAALAKVTPGRVSQWISEGKIGPEEMEGHGQRAKIKVEAACEKLKLKIDADLSQKFSAADHQFLTLGSTLADANAAHALWRERGAPAAMGAIDAMRRFVDTFAALPAFLPRRGNNKRGPRPQYDPERARVHLIALANSVDGLPDNQTAIVNWLRDRLANEGRDVPSDSTLKRYVYEFKAWTSILDRRALQRFHDSPALQRDFDTADDYLNWCQLQERLAQKWLHDARLQAQFTTPSDYIASVFENYSARDAVSLEGA